MDPEFIQKGQIVYHPIRVTPEFEQIRGRVVGLPGEGNAVILLRTHPKTLHMTLTIEELELESESGFIPGDSAYWIVPDDTTPVPNPHVRTVRKGRILKMTELRSLFHMPPVTDSEHDQYAWIDTADLTQPGDTPDIPDTAEIIPSDPEPEPEPEPETP